MPQKVSLMKESSHSVHLNQILDVLLLYEALLRDLELAVVVDVPPAPPRAIKPTTRCEAA